MYCKRFLRHKNSACYIAKLFDFICSQEAQCNPIFYVNGGQKDKISNNFEQGIQYFGLKAGSKQEIHILATSSYRTSNPNFLHQLTFNKQLSTMEQIQLVVNAKK